LIHPGPIQARGESEGQHHNGNVSDPVTAQSVLKRAVHKCSGGAAERPVGTANKESNMQDPKEQKPARQPELPKKKEPVQKQPANDRPVQGQGVTKDERAQEQPADKRRAMQNK
jgi:hypothetical protein